MVNQPQQIHYTGVLNINLLMIDYFYIYYFLDLYINHLYNLYYILYICIYLYIFCFQLILSALIQKPSVFDQLTYTTLSSTTSEFIGWSTVNDFLQCYGENLLLTKIDQVNLHTYGLHQTAGAAAPQRYVALSPRLWM